MHGITYCLFTYNIHKTILQITLPSRWRIMQEVLLKMACILVAVLMKNGHLTLLMLL